MGTARDGVFAFPFGAMRPTTFPRVFGFAFVVGFFFFAGFFFGGGGFFAIFTACFFDFNDAAARFNFPAISFRVEAGTAEPAAARFALCLLRCDSRFARRWSSLSR